MGISLLFIYQVSNLIFAQLIKSIYTISFTASNNIYISGKIQKTNLPIFTKISLQHLPFPLSYIRISKFDDIFLIIENQKVYKSGEFSKIEEIKFENFDLLKDNSSFSDISFGSNFLSLLTMDGKFLTTFDEHLSNSELKEYEKLSNLKTVSILSGLNHMLMLSKPRINKLEIIINSSFNQTYIIEPNPHKKSKIESSVMNLRQPINCEDVTEYLEINNNENYQNSSSDTSLYNQNDSRATTLEYKDTDSKSNSSAGNADNDKINGNFIKREQRSLRDFKQRQSADTKNDNLDIRYIENGIHIGNSADVVSLNDSTYLGEKLQSMEISNIKNLKLKTQDDLRDICNEKGVVETKVVQRIKTPMPKIRKPISDEDDSSSGMDSSTESFHESDYSDEEFTLKRTKEKSNSNSLTSSKPSIKIKNFFRELKNKGREISCKNNDNVIAEGKLQEESLIIVADEPQKTTSMHVHLF